MTASTNMSTAELYTCYSALCTKLNQKRKALSSFKNKALLLEIIDQLVAEDDVGEIEPAAPAIIEDEAPAAGPMPDPIPEPTTWALITEKLNKMQRAKLRKRYGKLVTGRWTTMKLPLEVVQALGVRHKIVD